MLERFIPFIPALWTHRDLLWQFTQRNTEIRHKGSHLGLVWSFLNPLLMLVMYVLVFGLIFGGSFGVIPNETKFHYAVGIFLGLTLYNFIAEVMNVSPIVIVCNPNFVKKVVFPLEILPAAAVGSSLFHMLISLLLALLAQLLFGISITFSILWLPIILIPIIMFSLGTAWLLSAVGTFFRDVSQAMAFLTTALMWGSAVFFTAQKYPAAWPYLRFNPLLIAIDLVRDVTLWNHSINYRHLLYLYLSSYLLCYIGYRTFQKMKSAFADVL